jgi:hypothetical protein
MHLYTFITYDVLLLLWLLFFLGVRMDPLGLVAVPFQWLNWRGRPEINPVPANYYKDSRIVLTLIIMDKWSVDLSVWTVLQIGGTLLPDLAGSRVPPIWPYHLVWWWGYEMFHLIARSGGKNIGSAILSTLSFSSLLVTNVQCTP